ncbi:MAG TPA: hypothetical protein VGB78_02375 [Thermoplasmata archaeon]
MKLSLFGRTLSFRSPLLYGIILVVAGIVLLSLAYIAQADIDEIGTTTDPGLLERIGNLEDERDIYLVVGFACIFIGVFASVVMVEKSMPAGVTESQMISAARTANDVVLGLNLTGNAAFLPAKKGLTRERVFIPAPKDKMVPPFALSDDLTVSPGRDGSSPGVLLEPYGLALLNTIETDLGVQFKDVNLEAAEGSLQYLKHGLSMMRDFHFKERDGKTVLRVEYSGLLGACRTVRKEKPDTCCQMPCIGCSCLLTAAARATGKIASIDEVDNKEDMVVFTLSLVEW